MQTRSLPPPSPSGGNALPDRETGDERDEEQHEEDVEEDFRDAGRAALIAGLQQDLAREYQAVIAYVAYSAVLKGAQYTHIAKELEQHAKEELAHALTIAKQLDHLGEEPTVTPKPVKMSDDPRKLLRFDFENERVTILAYRQRVRQCEARRMSAAIMLKTIPLPP